MLNQRLKAAKTVFSELVPTEQLIEDALVRNARLTIAIVEGRQSARLPITAGQESLAAIRDVQAALVDARLHIGSAHAALAQDKVQIGLGARAMGDWGECPKVAAQAEQPAPTGLRAVA